MKAPASPSNVGALSHGGSVSFTDVPAVRVLSNGHYTVMLHGQGGGFSRFDGWALNDWNGDRLQEQGGWIVYVRDLDSGTVTPFWLDPSLSRDSTLDGDEQYARISRTLADLTVTMQVHVAADHACEVRQLTIASSADRVVRLQVTAYLPIALNHPAAHAAHPAFSKLFVQTEWLPDAQALVARRRPRAAGERAPCVAAKLLGPGEVRWDSDRARFLGRGWGLAKPQGVIEGLAAHQSNVLDPAFVLQRSVVIAPGQQESLTLVMGAAETREEAASLMQLPLDALLPRAPGQSAIAFDPGLQSLVGAMCYGWPGIAAPAAERQQASGHPGVVWGFGMPTDRPFLLVNSDDAGVLRWAVQARRYWAGLGIDIPVLMLVNAADAVSPNAVSPDAVAPEPGVVVRKSSEVAPPVLQGLRAVAACVVEGDQPANTIPPSAAQGAQSSLRRLSVQAGHRTDAEALLFDNGYGGFSADGREYVVRLASTGERLVLPPVPWVNVLANEHFGCLVSETGAGSTWSCNSRERRITPWTNDPVLDPHDEALYLKDNDQGVFWSPLPGPALSGANYETRHGFGLTRFQHECNALRQETTVFVHRELPVKVTRLQLTNQSSQVRRLTVYSTQRLVLGFVPSQASAYVGVNVDAARRALVASNRLGGEFAAQQAFAACVVGGNVDWQACTDRQRFLGVPANSANPAGLHDDAAFTPAGDSADPFFAQRVTLEIPPGAEVVVSFLLGDAASDQQLHHCLASLGSDNAIVEALAAVQSFWNETLSAVQVKTPSTSLDFMLNGWLLYQTLVCRIWGRTAFYQSSGAFGFRDQLQDSGALVYSRPDLTRKQILLHASRQFVEGDVQHWWHEPPIDRGLRTRFSDDLNWLPLLASFYIRSTGDGSLLDEIAPFLTAPALAHGEDEVYLQAQPSGQSADVYEHCCRALDISLTQGQHGLPLMGTGDWNDGMNRIGREGKGESVWMGFFLYYILGEFLPFCEQRNDSARVQRYRQYREHLAAALNADGWDGDWYRRAWYDNGAVVGSKASDECQIDALAQAWAVISGVAPGDRASRALESLEQRLVDPVGKLIRLLAPSFVNTPNDPGYIKGYVAGVRENGGQYTHAASWVVRAMAEMGYSERALALLEMILPIAHTSTRAETDIYKTEPYVAVADIYGEAPHVGRGGWTWYTGSSGWLYRVGLESVLGFTLRDASTLLFKPCVPTSWDAYSVRYRMPQGGVIDIQVQCHGEQAAVYLDDVLQPSSVTGELAVRISTPADNHFVRIVCA